MTGNRRGVKVRKHATVSGKMEKTSFLTCREKKTTDYKVTKTLCILDFFSGLLIESIIEL